MAKDWGKMTSDQRKLINLIRKTNSLLKKAVRPVGKALIAKVRNNCPVRDGYLKKSIGSKEIAKSGSRVTIIVGPRRDWQRTQVNPAGGETIIRPAKYATAVNQRTGFLDNSLSSADSKAMQANISQLIKEVLA